MDYVVEYVVGIGGVGGVELKLVYYGDWLGVYGYDVVDDVVYFGGCVLVGFDVGWVVV